MTKIISFFNQAGGQGKTVLTMNLGYHLSQRGARVLLVDMDGQASLTRQAGVKTPSRLERSIFDALIDRKNQIPMIKGVHDMDWIPANSKLYTLDFELANFDKPALKLRERLQPLHKNYDWILIDCPPSLDFKSVNALIASTHFIVPVETAEKGTQGLTDLLATISLVLKMGNADIRPVGVVPNIYDKRETACKHYLAKIQKIFGEHMTVFPPIPRRTDFKHAWGHASPLKEINPDSDVLALFDKICDHLEAL